MELEGRLQQKFDVREGVGQNSGNPWKIASYLLVIPGTYEHKVAFEVSDGQSGRISQWDGFIGQDVVVSFDINAREYNGRWFNSIRGYAIRPKAQQTATPSGETSRTTTQPTAQTPPPVTTQTQQSNIPGLGDDADPPF